MAIPVPKNIICDLQDAPTKEYYDMYYVMNKILNEIVIAGETFLQEKGYRAYAQALKRTLYKQFSDI